MVSACIIGSLWLLYRYAKRVLLRFRLPAEDVITGRFNGEEVVSAASATADVSEQRHLSSLISKEQVKRHGHGAPDAAAAPAAPQAR